MLIMHIPPLPLPAASLLVKRSVWNVSGYGRFEEETERRDA
jgi:hypothetical protein